MSGDRPHIERVFILLALAALAAGVVYSEISRRRDEARAQAAAAEMKTEVAAAKEKADAALAAVIPQSVIAKALPSVYLIVVDGQPRATAFVIDRTHGVLATAAHSAASLPLDDPKADIHIVNRISGRAMRVTGRRFHVGFGAFRDLVGDYAPIRKNSSIYVPMSAPFRDLAFDAAFITVDPANPVTGENVLGPDLKVGTESDLLALAPGAPIAVLGYPYDTLDDGFQADSAEPRVDRGVISAMIAPIDDAGDEKDPVLANLIIHRLSTAGGNSGSPIIDAKGEVIGIHTHGIETPSSNADGAAQRADVIYDLENEGRDAERLKTVFLPAWRRRLGYWARADEVLPWSFYMEYAHPGEKPAPTVGQIDYTAKPPFEKQISALTFSAPVGEMQVAASDATDQNGAPASFKIDEAGQFAEKWFTVEPGYETVLFAYDYSLRSRTGSCRLTSYWRQRGGTRFRIQRAKPSFEAHIPAASTKADYEVVFRREPGCDPLRAGFFAGQISWPAPVVTASLEAGADEEAGAGSQSEAFFYNARASARRFFSCVFRKRPHRGICEKREFIEIQAGKG